jgi:hypothetical protein
VGSVEKVGSALITKVKEQRNRRREKSKKDKSRKGKGKIKEQRSTFSSGTS